jgi:hypothetical protein
VYSPTPKARQNLSHIHKARRRGPFASRHVRRRLLLSLSHSYLSRHTRWSTWGARTAASRASAMLGLAATLRPPRASGLLACSSACAWKGGGGEKEGCNEEQARFSEGMGMVHGSWAPCPSVCTGLMESATRSNVQCALLLGGRGDGVGGSSLLSLRAARQCPALSTALAHGPQARA